MSEFLIHAEAARPYNDEHWLAPLDWQQPSNGATLLIGPEREIGRAYMRMLGGVEPPESGELQLLGHDMRDMPVENWRNLRRSIGYISNGAPLLSVLNGQDNVILPALYHRLLPRDEAIERANVLLQQLGFDSELTFLPAYYDKLQRLQLAIARALILHPPLLMLESLPLEPDSRARVSMLDFLNDWKQHSALLLRSSNLYFNKHLADVILYIDREVVHTFHSWQEFIESEDPNVRRYIDLRREQMQIF